MTTLRLIPRYHAHRPMHSLSFWSIHFQESARRCTQGFCLLGAGVIVALGIDEIASAFDCLNVFRRWSILNCRASGSTWSPDRVSFFSQRNNGDLQQDGDEGLQAAPSRRECGKMKNKAEIPEPNRPPTAEALRKMITSGKSVPSKTSAQ